MGLGSFGKNLRDPDSRSPDIRARTAYSETNRKTYGRYDAGVRLERGLPIGVTATSPQQFGPFIFARSEACSIEINVPREAVKFQETT